jgi:hypothetical protein
VLRIYRELDGFVRNAVAALRLLTLRAVERRDFHVTIHQIVLLALAGTGAALMLDRASAGAAREFSEAGFAAVSASYLIAFLGCYLADRTQRTRHGTNVLLVMVLMAGLYAQLAVWLVGTWWRIDWLVVVLLTAWTCVVLWRAVRVVYASGWLRSAVGALVLLLVAVAMPRFFLPDDKTWHGVSLTGPRPTVNVEQIYEKQWELLHDKVATMTPQRPGEVDFYFVGFAGSGGQDAFMKEVRSAQALFDERFETRGRSLALINNIGTVESQPLASVTNLRDGLRALGRKMDVEEDVLFLYLTSNGSEEGSISVRLANLQLNHLKAEELRRMLDASRIKWRVLVISACHSGSFIDALKDERTLIVTAVAKGKNAFGCSNHFDFNYFGEAFIDRALRQHEPFVQAFDQAKRFVGVSARSGDVAGPEPQIFVGSEIASKLDKLEDRLRQFAPQAALSIEQ